MTQSGGVRRPGEEPPSSGTGIEMESSGALRARKFEVLTGKDALGKAAHLEDDVHSDNLYPGGELPKVDYPPQSWLDWIISLVLSVILGSWGGSKPVAEQPQKAAEEKPPEVEVQPKDEREVIREMHKAVEEKQPEVEVQPRVAERVVREAKVEAKVVSVEELRAGWNKIQTLPEETQSNEIRIFLEELKESEFQARGVEAPILTELSALRLEIEMYVLTKAWEGVKERSKADEISAFLERLHEKVIEGERIGVNKADLEGLKTLCKAVLKVEINMLTEEWKAMKNFPEIKSSVLGTFLNQLIRLGSQALQRGGKEADLDSLVALHREAEERLIIEKLKAKWNKIKVLPEVNKEAKRSAFLETLNMHIESSSKEKSEDNLIKLKDIRKEVDLDIQLAQKAKAMRSEWQEIKRKSGEDRKAAMRDFSKRLKEETEIEGLESLRQEVEREIMHGVRQLNKEWQTIKKLPEQAKGLEREKFLKKLNEQIKGEQGAVLDALEELRQKVDRNLLVDVTKGAGIEQLRAEFQSISKLQDDPKPLFSLNTKLDAKIDYLNTFLRGNPSFSDKAAIEAQIEELRDLRKNAFELLGNQIAALGESISNNMDKKNLPAWVRDMGFEVGEQEHFGVAVHRIREDLDVQLKNAQARVAEAKGDETPTEAIKKLNADSIAEDNRIKAYPEDQKREIDAENLQSFKAEEEMALRLRDEEGWEQEKKSIRDKARLLKVPRPLLSQESARIKQLDELLADSLKKREALQLTLNPDSVKTFLEESPEAREKHLAELKEVIAAKEAIVKKIEEAYAKKLEGSEKIIKDNLAKIEALEEAQKIKIASLERAKDRIGQNIDELNRVALEPMRDSFAREELTPFIRMIVYREALKAYQDPQTKKTLGQEGGFIQGYVNNNRASLKETISQEMEDLFGVSPMMFSGNIDLILNDAILFKFPMKKREK